LTLKKLEHLTVLFFGVFVMVSTLEIGMNCTFGDKGINFMKIGINGFGRIGRTIAKINAIRGQFDLVMINDINTQIDNMAYLFKYDSTYGKYPGDVSCTEKTISIDGKEASYNSFRDMEEVDWGSCGVDAIIDASGVTENVLAAKSLTKSGIVKKVVVTHSSGAADKEVIMGVNEDILGNDDHVISNSICDANAIAHILKWLDDEYGIDTGSLTTLHPWLSYQNLVDGPAISQSTPGMVWKDYALGRTSIGGVIPKNTTAMTATEKVLPKLKGKIMSFSYRIPTSIVATSDITVKTKRVPSNEELRKFLEGKITNSPYVRGNYESLVSVDYERESVSAIVDMQWLKVENGLIKIVLWYDNEWGYSSRALDLLSHLTSEKQVDTFCEQESELVGSVGN
jgi:glyceraldehyde 3-phosphate dehydrogenase